MKEPSDSPKLRSDFERVYVGLLFEFTNEEPSKILFSLLPKESLRTEVDDRVEGKAKSNQES